jgi:hypothetical protein
MKSIVVAVLFALSTTAHSAGSGDHLARPMSQAQVQVQSTWTWHKGQAVYPVRVTQADHHAVAYAAEAVLRQVQPTFRTFSTAMAARLNLYVVDQYKTGTTTTIYIQRNIETDWLIGG